MNLKQQVGEKAAEFVEEGMTIGLGTGSTTYYLVEALGKRINEEGLNITGVTTSLKTAEHARSLNIPLKELDEVTSIDLTIDGADEISDDYHGVKGGGAAHLYEKIVATSSNKNMWIVDSSKRVSQLGAFPLPVEVVKFGSSQLFQLFKEESLAPNWRGDESGGKLRTDDGNYVIDLHMGIINNPHSLAIWLSNLAGVVEHGLFLGVVNIVIVGTDEGPEIITAR